MAELLILHLTFYAVALWGWSSKSSAGGALKIPLYFVTVNLAILVAWGRYLKGNRMVMWAPSER